jgi:mRNA interferase HigB
MRIIKRKPLREFASVHPDSVASLDRWYVQVRLAAWKDLGACRRDFPQADLARVASGKSVVIFNIAGNKYRLACAIHFNRGCVFVLRVMTHAEYSANRWKETL